MKTDDVDVNWWTRNAGHTWLLTLQWPANGTRGKAGIGKGPGEADEAREAGGLWGGSRGGEAGGG